ncbi:hypothetical protein ACQP1W_10875 [Spirillospora sp. CA-255316]
MLIKGTRSERGKSIIADAGGVSKVVPRVVDGTYRRRGKGRFPVRRGTALSMVG